ncbi:MAG: hypothetical protein FH749_14110 [Firmicutes bacterium]|nr:hypothetical protein [Bacillota bacterium]
MDKVLAALLQEWEFTKSCTKSFINELSDEDLNRKLPRKGLDTFRKHFQEMIAVQKDYVAAISSGVRTLMIPLTLTWMASLAKSNCWQECRKLMMNWPLLWKRPTRRIQ